MAVSGGKGMPVLGSVLVDAAVSAAVSAQSSEGSSMTLKVDSGGYAGSAQSIVGASLAGLVRQGRGLGEMSVAYWSRGLAEETEA